MFTRDITRKLCQCRHRRH